MTSETTSSDAGAADDDSAIDARVQAVQGQVAALESALSASRKSRTIILVGMVSVLGVITYYCNDLATKLQSEEYITSLSTEAQTYLDNNSAEYMKEVQTLSENIHRLSLKRSMSRQKKTRRSLR